MAQYRVRVEYPVRIRNRTRVDILVPSVWALKLPRCTCDVAALHRPRQERKDDLIVTFVLAKPVGQHVRHLETVLTGRGAFKGLV